MTWVKWLNGFALLLSSFCLHLHAEKIVLVAGGGEASDNAPPLLTKLDGPFAVVIEPNGNMFIVEMPGNRLCWWNASKDILTIAAGTGEKGFAGDGSHARLAKFDGPHSAVVGPTGGLFIADTWNNRIRRIDPKTLVISTVAGTGEKGFSGDGGPAVKAQFGGIYCVAVDAAGQNLYAADLRIAPKVLLPGRGCKGTGKDTLCQK